MHIGIWKVCFIFASEIFGSERFKLLFTRTVSHASKLREGTFNFARNFCSGVVGSP